MIFKKKESKGYFKRTNTKHFNFRQTFHAFDVETSHNSQWYQTSKVEYGKNSMTKAIELSI